MTGGRDTLRLESAIESERRWCDRLSPTDRLLVAELMTIQASAYLEAACREIVTAYAARHAEPEVARFVEQQMQRFGTPRMDRIVAIVRSLEESKAEELSAFARGRLAESVNTLVHHRNRIAHGREAHLEIPAIVRHFRDAQEVAHRLGELLS